MSESAFAYIFFAVIPLMIALGVVLYFESKNAKGKNADDRR